MTLPQVLIVDEPAQRLAFYRSVLGDLATLSAPAGDAELIESLQQDCAVILLNLTTTAARIRSHPGRQRTPLLFIGTAAPADAITGPVDFLPTPEDPEGLRTKVRLFAQLQRASGDLAQLHEKFLSIMLHELRSPLNAILGWTTLLRTGRVDAPTAERALETIERNARAQTQLIESLQDEARIIAGKVQLELADGGSALGRGRGRHRRDGGGGRPADHAEHRLRRLRPADTRRSRAPAAAARSSACQCHPGFPRRRRGAGASRPRCGGNPDQRHRYRFGIAPELLPQLFDRFRQDEGSAGRRRGGRGLGLTLVRRLVELHGGMVSADSAGEGQGATFTVRLPSALTSQSAAPS